jgi:hypothetical protein
MKLFEQEATTSDEFIAAISSFIAYVYTGKQVTLFKKLDGFYSENWRRENICRLPFSVLPALFGKHIAVKVVPLEYGWSKDRSKELYHI